MTRCWGGLVYGEHIFNLTLKSSVENFVSHSRYMIYAIASEAEPWRISWEAAYMRRLLVDVFNWLDPAPRYALCLKEGLTIDIIFEIDIRAIGVRILRDAVHDIECDNFREGHFQPRVFRVGV